MQVVLFALPHLGQVGIQPLDFVAQFHDFFDIFILLLIELALNLGMVLSQGLFVYVQIVQNELILLPELHHKLFLKVTQPLVFLPQNFILLRELSQRQLLRNLANTVGTVGLLWRIFDCQLCLDATGIHVHYLLGQIFVGVARLHSRTNDYRERPIEVRNDVLP